MFKKYLLAGLALLNMGATTIKAMQSEDAALLQRNSCPAELQELLDQAYNRDSEFRKKMNESRDAEGYFVTSCPNNFSSCMIKGYNENNQNISNSIGPAHKPNHGKWNKSRIVELEKFNAIKAENNLKGPQFPRKCFWHVPDRPADDLNDQNYFVVAEKFNLVINNDKRFPFNSGFKYSDFSAKELHDLLVFIKKANFGHVHDGNLYPVLQACNAKNFWEKNNYLKSDCAQLAMPVITIIDTKKTLQYADDGYRSLALLAWSNRDLKANLVVESFLKNEEMRKKWRANASFPQPEKLLKQMRKAYEKEKQAEQKRERQMATFDPVNG